MNKTGIVFDIQRCSLYDGPGIRTTVFLKGCPLRCKWCHNPESQLRKPELMFYKERCVHCLACVQVCPAKAHGVEEGKHILDHSLCKTCGTCISACMSNALEIKGQEMEACSIFEEVEKDRAYYNASGGGITLSGGEPMAQFDFTRALLTEARQREIHTCMETCGYAALQQYEEILPYVDLFLFDYKATDEVKHEELTGVSNQRILENLEHLYQQGASIILRCPLVPGINDDEFHLKGIAELCMKYPNLAGIEIMAYHNMGVSKSFRIGKEAHYVELQNTSEEQKEEWIKKLRQYGCQKATIG